MCVSGDYTKSRIPQNQTNLLSQTSRSTIFEGVIWTAASLVQDAEKR